MIIEDFCSFEVAKLLKEKGFNTSCMGRYSVRSKEFHLDGTKMCSNEGLFEYAAPTHQMAMKWLRNEHNIMVSPYTLSLGYYFEIFDLTTKDITGCKPLYKVGIPSKEDVLSTYEEAVEAGIKYSLENLI